MRPYSLLLSCLLLLLPCWTQAQVQVPKPSDEDFATSNILAVYDGSTQVGTLCREYIVPKGRNTRWQRTILYRANADGATDYSHGYLIDFAYELTWDLAANECSLKPASTSYDGVFITREHTVSYKAIPGAKEAILRPIILLDRRGDNPSTEKAYGLVKIGAQIWMRENLATTHWQDGAPITSGLSKDQWLGTTEAAYAIYENNPENLTTLGALYNFFAVVDPRGLAPQGWSIPSDEEWHQLLAYIDPQGIDPNPDDLSYESEQGGLRLKSTSGWETPPNPEPGAVLKQGNNETGFNALPAGSTSTSKYMDYSARGRQAYFWTRSSYENEAMFRRFFWDSDISNRFHEKKQYGYSVRCMKPATAVDIEETADSLKIKITRATDQEQAAFKCRIAATSGQVTILDAAGIQHTFTVDKEVKEWGGGFGTLVSIPSAQNNGAFTILGQDIVYLDLSEQHITEISFDDLPFLHSLILNANQLSHLDIAPLKALKLLYAHSNQLSDIKLPVPSMIQELILLSNQLTAIDLSDQVKLETLGIAVNKLSNLDLSNNRLLKSLDCQRNNLSELNVGHLRDLSRLNCRKNKLTALDIAQLNQLTWIDCADNQIAVLDVSLLSALEEINCGINSIKTLDLQNKEKLQALYAFSNEIAEIDLTGAPNIYSLSIGDNLLTHLDLSGHPNLSQVSAPINQIQSCKVYDCPKLEAISLFANKLTTLDLKQLPALKMLEIHHNQITAPLKLLPNLPQRDLEQDPGIIIFLSSNPDFDQVSPEGNIVSDDFINQAKSKGWVITDDETPIKTGVQIIDPNQPIDLLATDKNHYILQGVGIRSWRLYNLQGQPVIEASTPNNPAQIDLSDLPAGNYLLHVITLEDTPYTLKINQ